MSGMSTPTGWGPSHQTKRKRSRNPWWFQAIGYTLFAAWLFLSGTTTGLLVIFIGPMFVLSLLWLAASLAGWSETTATGKILIRGQDPLAAVKEYARREGGGTYLGLEEKGDLRFARSQRAVLLLGPTRSGKTSAVIIPALIVHRGPAVCTSTKTDVAASTWPARTRSGRLWVFDPTGTGERTVLAPLRWSPIRCATGWDGAMLMARAMTAGVGAGTTHGSHWAKRSQALLAPFLHAAAIDGRDMKRWWTG